MTSQEQAFKYLDANRADFEQDGDLNATAAGESLIDHLGGYDEDEAEAYEHSMAWVMAREEA